MEIRRKGKLKPKEIKIISMQMCGMLRSGCDIITVLDTIIYSSTDKISETMLKIRDEIEFGKSITESFSRTNMFPKFFTNVLYAGDSSGNTDIVFEKLAQYYDREEKVKAKIMSASIYPAILFLVSTIAINFIFIFVIGNFKKAFDIGETNIPNSTKVIFFISDFIRKYIVYIYVLIFLSIIYTVKTVRESDRARLWIDKKKMSMPILRGVISLKLSEKFSRVLLIMISSGINITDSMEAATNVIGNRYAEMKLEKSMELIEEGNQIADSLEQSGIFPKVFISMLKSGEESGNFDKSLEEISTYFNQELDIKVEKILKTMEPLMIAVMGLIIGITMISLIYPMINMISGIE